MGQVRAASEAHWERFWSEGGVLDLSESDLRRHLFEQTGGMFPDARVQCRPPSNVQ